MIAAPFADADFTRIPQRDESSIGVDDAVVDRASQGHVPGIFSACGTSGIDLIVHLIENRARIVDKDELIARVWKGALMV